MDNEQLRKIIEAALMTAGRSLDIAAFEGLFNEAEKPERETPEKSPPPHCAPH